MRAYVPQHVTCIARGQNYPLPAGTGSMSDILYSSNNFHNCSIVSQEQGEMGYR